MEPMIIVTRLNRTRFAVNPDLIERIQAAPDTTLIMVDGATFIVRETMDDVIAQVADFRARVLAAAADPTRSSAPTTSPKPEYGELR